MPEDTGLPPNPQAAADEVKRKNAEVARQLEDQGRQYDDPQALDDTGSALDDLARQASGEGGSDGQEGSGAASDEGAAGGTDDGAAGGQAGADDGAEGAGKGADGAGEDDSVVTKKEDDDGDGASGGDGSPDAGRSDDAGGAGDAGGDPAGGDQGLDDVRLPDTVTPKSAEAFQQIKERAKAQLAEREAKIAELQRERDELKAKADQALPPEAKEELEELRQFRTKLDIEVDPQFKQYDQKIASASEFVYAQLERAGITKEVIDKIKEFGGPHKVKMDKILDTVDDRQVERIVSSKVADIEQADFDKKQAIEKAKENVSEYLKQRQEQIEQGANQHRTITRQVLDKAILPKFDFLQEPKAPAADASEDEKKLFASRKQFVAEAKKTIDDMLNDDSPEMRAIMAGGAVKSMYLHTVIEGQKKTIETKDAEIAKITKDRDEAVAMLERLKKGSISQRGRSNSTGTSPNPTLSFDPNQTTDDALDSLAKRLGQERRAGVS